MKKWKLSRENYEYWYRQLRKDGVTLSDVYARNYNPDIAPSKALTSFEHREDLFSGWINPDRKHDWFIATTAKTFREDYFRK